MEELLVIIGAELILLMSIMVMMIHQRQADVLTRYSFDNTDYAASDAGRNKWVRTGHEREKHIRRAPPAREHVAKTIARIPQRSHRAMAPVPPEISDFVKRSMKSRAQYTEQAIGRIDDRRNTPDRGHRVPASLPHGVRIYAIGDIHGRWIS